jgi:hypothetical protein
VLWIRFLPRSRGFQSVSSPCALVALRLELIRLLCCALPSSRSLLHRRTRNKPSIRKLYSGWPHGWTKPELWTAAKIVADPDCAGETSERKGLNVTLMVQDLPAPTLDPRALVPEKRGLGTKLMLVMVSVELPVLVSIVVRVLELRAGRRRLGARLNFTTVPVPLKLAVCGRAPYCYRQRRSVGSDFRRFEGHVDRATRSCGKAQSAQSAGIRCMTCVGVV